MSELGGDILQSGEIEIYVQSLQPSKVEDLGTPLWIEMHHRLQKLNQQSSIEAVEMREEVVKDFIISYGKSDNFLAEVLIAFQVSIIIHEAICIQVWREKIFSQILKLSQQPQNTFIAYTILFHEITAVSLLTNILYHTNSLEGLEDALVDLIDYCASEVVRLLSEDPTKFQESSHNLTNIEELEYQSKTISFNIGLSAICILRYLSEYGHELPLSAVSRMYKTHDIPLLMANLIQVAPWKRINPKANTVQIFEDRTWKNIEKISGIPKYEGQCWLALRFLLIDLRNQGQYDIDNFRKECLLKIQKFLTEDVIDQLPFLIDLKQFFSHLMIRPFASDNKKVLIMETIPEIKSGILKQCFKKWKSITKKHIELIFFAKKDVLMEVAKRLGDTYDIDHLEKLNPEGPICSNCGDEAFKRCSRCKNEWYCGRECQVKRWPRHKTVCNVMCVKHDGGGGSGDGK